MKRCPKCGKDFPDDANFCPVDAGRLEPVADAAEAAGAPEESAGDTGLLGGRFELGAEIGGGRTGRVLEAVDQESGAACVVKLVAEEVLSTPLLLQRTERELKQLQRLEVPGVARVLDHGKRQSSLWVAVEKVAGTSLERLITEGGPMAAARAAPLIARVGEALAEAAKLGVIHRDLAPKNVLFGAGDEVKLINFGIPVPGPNKVHGVPAFVSPEHVEGKPVDQRSNIYSLGALYYFLLTGRAPFEGTPEEVHRAHLERDPPRPSSITEVSAEIEEIVLKALEKSSSKRFMTLRQLLGDLERLGGGAAVAARQALPMPAGKGGGRHSPAQTMIGMGALTADSGGGLEQKKTDVYQAPPEPAEAAPGAPVGEDPTVPVARETRPVDDVQAAGGPVPNPQLRQSEGEAAAKAPAGKKGRAKAAPAPGSSQKAKKGKFRETMWFKKGELDAAAAEAAARAAAEGKEVDRDRADSMPIDERYGDDGTLSAQDRERLSLRTGGTQMMKAVGADEAAPSDVSESELVSEMRGNRGLIIGAACAFVVVIAIILLIAL